MDLLAASEAGNLGQKRRRLNVKHSPSQSIYSITSSDHGGGQLSPPEHGTCTSPGRAVTSTSSACQYMGRFDSAGSKAADDELSECCYGMLSAIPLRLRNALGSLHTNPTPIPVRLENRHMLSAQNEHGSIALEISDVTSSIIYELAGVAELATQLYCYWENCVPRAGSSRRNGRAKQTVAWYANAILYGPARLETTIGDYLSKRQFYLQDPLACDRNVPYRNPHVFPPENGEVTMTNAFESAPIRAIEIEQLKAGPGLLAQLMKDNDPLPETEPPWIVQTQLFPHQKQALTFMLRREQGWALANSSGDIWSRQDTYMGHCKYKNNVNGSFQHEAPPSFQGGLLADDMGLGKTLSMISLIAADRIIGIQSPAITPGPYASPFPAVVKTTLLVVPPPLMQAWEKQLDIHIKKNGLKWYIFHGQNRKATDYLAQNNIVITTYQTVSAIWRKEVEKSSSDSIFHVEWHRIILDEAHTIQNAQSDLAQACCSLKSRRRWAITGTPIQNKLTDFCSLVKFLQVHPYSHQSTFDEEISKPWRRGDPQGYLRLRMLVRAITISRTKEVIDLPERRDEVHHLDFTLDEREAYLAEWNATIPQFKDAITSGLKGGATLNALQKLNTLRLFCNHGALTQPSRATGSFQDQSYVDHRQHAVDESTLGDILGESGVCTICGTDLVDDILEDLSLERISTHHDSYHNQRIFARCNAHSPCPGLGKRRWDNGNQLNDEPSSSPSPASLSNHEDLSMIGLQSMPTKITALANDLVNHHHNEKSAVFSFWTYTLDLIQLMLDHHGVQYTRIDGKMSLPRRTEALRAFHADDQLRVILVSISCGGAGLDLTAASRAYLIEPQWNPMVEEQALCRVHRVGQKRPVTTIRYLMRDSFEEKVVEIQQRKKKLMEVTFGKDPLGEGGIGLGTLEYLRSVLE